MVDFMNKLDAKVIEILGGEAHIRKLFNLSRQTAYNWRENGIPKLGKYMLRDYAKKLRVKLPAGFEP